MQNQVHELFQAWVRERRGDKLGRADELFTGEVWTGARAAELGLVDGLGTAREVLARRFPDATPVLVEGRKPLLAKLGVGGVARAAGQLDELLRMAEARAAWSRFGL
jgi:ClpP class serine protease